MNIQKNNIIKFLSRVDDLAFSLSLLKPNFTEYKKKILSYL